MISKLFTVIVVFGQLISSSYCYYWRDYHGKIPADAIKAGFDITNEPVYIGQAFIKLKYPGIYATAIQPGKDVWVPVFGAKKADNFVQILCGNDPENFNWEATNSTYLHLLETDNELVRGGLEDNQWLNIGRVKYQGGTVVGKVLAGLIEGSDFWFVHNGQEVKSTSYEVLTYNDVASKIAVRVKV